MNRVFHVAGISFVAVAFAVGCGLSAAYAAVSGVLLLAAAIFYGGFRGLPPWIYFMLSAVCVCAAASAVFDVRAREVASRYGGTAQPLKCTVLEREDFVSYFTLTVRVTQDGEPPGLAGTRIKMSVNGELDAQVGDIIEFTASLSCPEKDKNYLYSEGIRFRARALGEITVVPQPINARSVFAQLRSGIRENIMRALPGEEGEVLAAMLTGFKGRLSPELRYSYSRSGVAHLLAVSGLHLAVMVGLLDGMLCVLPISRRCRGALEIAAVLGFMALTGFPYSIIRAGVMSIIWRAALLLGRDSDSLNSLGFALVLMLIANPYAIYSVGLQLSYFATMGIAMFASPLTAVLCRRVAGQNAYQTRESRPKLYALLSALATTVAAQVFTAPLICWNFGQLSLVSPIVNILVSPLVPLALGCGMLCGLAGFFPLLELLWRLFGLLGGVSVQGINRLAREWSKPGFASISIRSEAVIFWMAAVVFTGILLYSAKAPARMWRYGASVMAISLMVVLLPQAAAGGTITVAALSGGNSVAVIRGTECAVIGVPKNTYHARNLLTLLQDYGVERISLLIIEREEQLYGDPVALLFESFPVESCAPLDKTRAFTAELAGQIRISSRGKNAEYITVEAGNMRIIKQFSTRFLVADMLINDDNEMIFAPDREFSVNDRYFGSSVIALRAQTG